MLVYFAAPLFCQAERTFNLYLTERLEEEGFSVFLPQRDGVDGSRFPYRDMTDDERTRAIFAIDREKLLEADIFLVVLDGRVPDEGACVELGLAYGQKHLLKRDKLLIGLQTDSRRAFPGRGVNAMIQGALDALVTDEHDLLTALEAYGGRTP